MNWKVKSFFFVWLIFWPFSFFLFSFSFCCCRSSFDHPTLILVFLASNLNLWFWLNCILCNAKIKKTFFLLVFCNKPINSSAMMMTKTKPKSFFEIQKVFFSSILFFFVFCDQKPKSRLYFWCAFILGLRSGTKFQWREFEFFNPYR